jgi:cytochrome subunit of sulfide dehydrogenase
MMKKSWNGWALAAGALAFSASALAGPPSADMLATACAGCHGTNGNSAGDTMPSLASQSESAIVEAMLKFKSGERASTIMGRLAKGYSDEQIKAIAGFFEKQKRLATNQKIDKAKVARGAKIEEKACSRCHLDQGTDGKDDTPVVASQWLPYLQIQMDLYESGYRKMPEKMAEKFKETSKQDLDALIHFYAAQK